MAAGYLLRNQVQWKVAHGWHPVLSLLVATAVWSAVRLLLKSKRVSPVAKQSIHSAAAGRCWRKIRFVQESPRDTACWDAIDSVDFRQCAHNLQFRTTFYSNELRAQVLGGLWHVGCIAQDENTSGSSTRSVITKLTMSFWKRG